MPDMTLMARTVLVCDRCPAYRLGVSVALAEADLTVLDAGGAAGAKIDGALVSVEDDDYSAALGSLRADHPSAVLVALLAQPSSAAFRAALLAGARGAVARDGPLDRIVQTLLAGMAGGVLVPAEQMAALLAGTSGEPALDIPPEQTDWLRRMAHGDTVARIATDAGYSERAMYRHLRALYSRLGARNRTEAVVSAMQRGLLAEASALWQSSDTDAAAI